MIEWRHERKIIINACDHASLSVTLRAALRPDPHCDSSGIYTVRSLYFDDVFDQALTDKISGMFTRKKFRLRIYNGNPDFILLEKKVKQGELGHKLKAILTEEECHSILTGEIDFLKERTEQVCRELYICLSTGLFRPCSIVEYDREAYIWEPGRIHITIDSNIRTSNIIADFLSPSLSLVGTSGGTRVLEIKYGNFIPLHISKLLQIDCRQLGTMSKYALSRRFC